MTETRMTETRKAETRKAETRIERHLDPHAAGSPLADLPALTHCRSGDHPHASQDVRVTIVMNDAAQTPRGQLICWAATNLLLRCFGAIDTVTVVTPDVPLTRPLPVLRPRRASATTPDTGPTSSPPDLTLHRALANLGTSIGDPNRPHPELVLTSNPEVAVGQPDSVTADVMLYVGDDATTLAPSAPTPSWVLTASNWKATIYATAEAARLDRRRLPRLDDDGDVMVAAWLVASIGAAEAFKVVGKMRLGAGRHIDVLRTDLWNGNICDGLGTLEGPDGPTESLSLPPHWLAGAGAVGEAYLAVLSTSNVDCCVAVVDHDDADDLNLNRHVVAGTGDIGTSKAELAVMRLNTEQTKLVAIPKKWQQTVASHPADLRDLPEKLTNEMETGSYRLVVCAVDKNKARAEVAASRPEFIFGASTTGLAIEVGRYGRTSPWQCLACGSPVRDETTLEEAAEELAGMSDAELDAQAARAGLDPQALRSYLANPTCGTLGANEVAKFAAYAQPDWSVSFVSAAAGALLAARVLRHFAGAADREHCSNGDTVRLWLHNATFVRTRHQRRSSCPICGGAPGPGAEPTAEPSW